MSLSDTHHTDESDVTLIERARAGDVDAFGVLHSRHVGSAQALARRMSRSTADADDLVSEGFARVLSALQRGKGPDVAFRPYLLSTIRRLAYDRTSREQREAPVVIDDGPEIALPVGDPVVDGFERDTAAAAFASLPERWRMVLWHTEVEGQSPAEVGALLGMNPNAVAALAYRAREGLRQAYLTEHAPRASTSKECELTTSRLGAYVRGGLTPARETRLRKHLDDCGDCQAAYLELASVNTAMPAIVVFAVLGPVGGAYLASVLGPSVTATAALIAGMSPVLQGGAGAAGGAGGAGAAAGSALGATGAAASGAGAGGPVGAASLGSAARVAANARYAAAAAAVVVVLAAVAVVAAFAGNDPSPTTAAPSVASPPVDVAPIVDDPAPEPGPTATAPPELTDPIPPATPPSTPFDPTPSPPRTPAPSPARPGPAAPRDPGVDPPTPSTPPAPEPPAPTPTTTTTTAPIATTTTTTTIPEPPVPPNLAVELSSAGVLVRDRPGVIVARITNAGGGPAGRSGLVFELTGARLRGLPQSPAGQRGTSSDAPRSNAQGDLVGDHVGAWSCEPIDTDAMTCTTESVHAGASSTLYVPVDVAGGDAPVAIRADVAPTGYSARPGPTSVTTLPVEPTGMAARFATIDRGAIATAGNTLLTCDPQAPRCTESLDGGVGALDNGSFAMVPVDVDDDPATTNSSGAGLTLTRDAAVLSATLYWSAGLGAGPGGTPAPAPDRRGEAVLTGPDGITHAVAAERVDDIAADQRYQALADVTDLVRQGGTGPWTFGGAQLGTGTNTYAGWSLIVAYRDASLPRRSLVVLDGFAAVNDSDTVSFTVGGFLVPAGGSPGALLDVVTYEGDNALLGDQLSVNGVALADESNPLGNSFNSSSSASGQPTPGRDPSWGNLLGIDLDRFDVSEVLSPGSTSTTITFSTAADRYLTGAVAVSIDQ